MNKWYKSGLMKGILIVLQHMLAAVAAVSLVWMVSYPAVLGDIGSDKPAETYADTKSFGQQVFIDSHDIMYMIDNQNIFTIDGKVDESKIIDVEEYDRSRSVSGENRSGLAYTYSELVEWYKEYEGMQYGATEYSNDGLAGGDSIIVCRKTDDTYAYYRYSEFSKLVSDGELKLIPEDEGLYAEDIMRMLKNGEMYRDSSLGMITDAEGQEKYTTYWNYDGHWTKEKYPPQGAADILEVVNTNPNWNGRLSEAYEMIERTLQGVGSFAEEYQDNQSRWREGDTNLSYLFVDYDNKRVYTNRENYKDFAQAEANLAKMQESGKYALVREKLADFKTNMNEVSAKEWKDIVSSYDTSKDKFAFAMNVDTTYPIQDDYYDADQQYVRYAPHIQTVIIMGIVALLLFLVIMVWLTAIAGRNTRDEELHLHSFDKWKTEIAAGGVFAAWFFSIAMLVDGFVNPINGGYYYYGRDWIENTGNMILYVFVVVFSCALFLIGYLSLVRRIKAKTLWKDSLLRWILGLIRQIFSHMHMVWKTAVVFGGFIVLHWIAFSSNGFFVFLMFIAEAAAGIYIMRQAIGYQKIKTGIERIASGEVDYKIPLKGLIRDHLVIAERVNAIGEGLDAAVEESMRSERLKTDLITNVSHDIKTPLTSIINYVDLLKRENFTDPRIIGYLDVLEAKAQRLKTLTEDVVEASKVSSGNITLEYMNINLVEMIQQTSGEFEEKFANRNLIEMLNVPEEEAVIRADGRRMWRVLENIYGNAAKYSMEGTRVYADLQATPTSVIFSLKNISEQPLNIHADELTERFIRGDISRSTEGSGLGLSIAKTLTEMQGGKFELYLDGDLFRVTITFPRMIKVN